MFHSDDFSTDILTLVRKEIRKDNHWLEGAIINGPLRDMDLSEARLPFANFDGSILTNVNFRDAFLERASFRDAKIEGVIFTGSDLRGAIFDRASLVKWKSSPTDFRYARLGQASFIGTSLQSARLLGANFSEPTGLRAVLETPSFEMEDGQWDEAATVLSVLGRRATEDWDFGSAEKAAFLAATCRHRQAINADPQKPIFQWTNIYTEWVAPTTRAGFRGWCWLGNRMFWGYGLRASYLAYTMIGLILFFGVAVFPFLNITCAPTGCSGIRLVDTLVFSLNTFVGLTYGPAIPQDWISASVAGFDALAGNIMLALFLVAVASKYLRRFGG